MRVQATLLVSSILALSFAACGSDDSGLVGPANDDGGGTADGAAPQQHVDAGTPRPDASGGQDAATSVDSGDPHVDVDAGAEVDSSGGTDSGGGVDAGIDAGHPVVDAGFDSGAHVDAGTDASTGGFVPAAHPPFPRLVSGGGPVLAHPIVQPVFFSNYDLTDKVTDMVNGLPSIVMPNGTTFWAASVAEYGVGPLTVKPPIRLTEAAPTTNTSPDTWLQGKLANDPAFASVDTNTIVAIFYPSTTPLAGSCAAQAIGYGGYHDNITTSRGDIPYAVMAECANFGAITNAQDMVTIAGSHEIIEAVTDPYPSSNSAYASLDHNGWAMQILLQGNAENGDLCTINAGFIRPSAAYPYLLQRGWSNLAAGAGNADPCAPDVRPSQPFVGAYPVMPDTITVSGGGSGAGVKIPLGTSRTIDVKLFSFEPTAEFTVEARQGRSVNPPQLSFSWDKTTGKNGDTLHLTVTVLIRAGNGHEAFLIDAMLPNTPDAQKTAWAAIVGQ